MTKQRRFSNPFGTTPSIENTRGRSNSSNSYFEELFGRHSTGSSLPTGTRRPVSVRPSEPLLSTIFSGTASTNVRSRRNYEVEQQALMDQITALQSTMHGLADMLRDQDEELAKTSSQNTRLTEELNRLADENVDLRRQIQEQRRLKNAAWEELQIYKMAARTRRDKLIIQQRAIANLSKQKEDLAKFSQELLEQLTNERKKHNQRRQTLKNLINDPRRFSTISVDFDDLEQETDEMMAKFHDVLAEAPVELSADLRASQAARQSTPEKKEAAPPSSATADKTTFLARPNINEEIESPRRSRNKQATTSSGNREPSPNPHAVRQPAPPRTFFPSETAPQQPPRPPPSSANGQKRATLGVPIKDEDFLSSSDDDDEFSFFNASPDTPIGVILTSIESKFQDGKGGGGSDSSRSKETDTDSSSVLMAPTQPRDDKTASNGDVSALRIQKNGVHIGHVMDSPSPDDRFDVMLDAMSPFDDDDPFETFKDAVSPNSSPRKNKTSVLEDATQLEVDEDLLFLEESFHEDEAPELDIPRNQSPSKSKSRKAPARRQSLSKSYSRSQSHSAIDDLWGSSDDSD